MKETTPAAMPPCFNRWCAKFDNIFRTKAQKREFRNYIGGLLGESKRKNLTQIARDSVGVHLIFVKTSSRKEVIEISTAQRKNTRNIIYPPL